MTHTQRVSTGVAGLDQILNGGLLSNRFYLVRGGPGRGKTTLGLHFVAAPPSDDGNNDKGLFITFQEATDQIRVNAEAQGIDCSDVSFLNLVPNSSFFTEREDYDVFEAADVERDPLASQIVEAVGRVKPGRVFIDSMTQLRFISPDSFQYRKQVLSLLRFLGDQSSTVLYSSEHTNDVPDDDLQFLSDGVINLDGDDLHSFVKVSKFRGSGFQNGPHDMRIDGAGLSVFPRLLPERRRIQMPEGCLTSGVPEIDQMLNGGLETGTVTLISGPSGIGKSTFTSLFARQASALGLRTAAFLFEEDRETFLRRTGSVNIPMSGLMDKGDLIVEQIEPMLYLADEFAAHVRHYVDQHNVGVVILDSLAGYEVTVRGREVRERMHALVKNLARNGVTVLLVNEVEAMTGQFRVSEKGISYLSDNIVFLRYVELDGYLKKAIGVLKKRLSDFERTLRLFDITPYGVKVGDPFNGLQGVLLGTPERQPAGSGP